MYFRRERERERERERGGDAAYAKRLVPWLSVASKGDVLEGAVEPSWTLPFVPPLRISLSPVSFALLPLQSGQSESVRG